MILHEARSQIYIANEFKKQEKLGVAVGVLRYAVNKFQGKSPGKPKHLILFIAVGDKTSGLKIVHHF